MEDARRMGVNHRIVFHLLVRRQPDDGSGAFRLQRRPPITLVEPKNGGAGDFPHVFPESGVERIFLQADRRAPKGDFFRNAPQRDLLLGVAQRNVRLGIGIGTGINPTWRIERAGIDPVPVIVGAPAWRHHEGRAAQIANAVDRLAPGQAVGQFDQRALGVAEDQQIGFRVDQHRPAHGVAPVVVVGDPAQRSLDRADHHGNLLERLAAALGIRHHGAIGPLAGFGIRRVGVVGANLAVAGVTIDHRIHVAGGHAEIEIRLAEPPEIGRRAPVRLADNADPEALRFQQPPDQRHAETGMVDIGVAGDQDHVAGIPAQLVHFGPRHRQEGRHAETVSPELFVAGQQVGWGGKRCGSGRCGGAGNGGHGGIVRFSSVRPAESGRRMVGALPPGGVQKQLARELHGGRQEKTAINFPAN